MNIAITFAQKTHCIDLIDNSVGNSVHLQELESFIDSYPREFRASLEIRDGRGFLKLGYIMRENQRFMKVALKAWKEGSLAEVDTGEIQGPKVLAILNLFNTRMNSDKSKVAKGWLDVDYNIARAGREKSNWLPREVEEFTVALEKLGINEACRKRKNLQRPCVLAFELSSSHPDQIQWTPLD